ncbi:MAG: hypothetical protein RL637_121 [Pseudomonadota bacterium]|jgi:hypothetical protein
MINHWQSLKINPMLIVGLVFIALLTACHQSSYPREVTINFWSAISEANQAHIEKESVNRLPILHLSCRQNLQLAQQNLCNINIQIAKIQIYYDQAEVETILTTAIASVRLLLITYLIRSPETDEWKVDYQRTMNQMVNNNSEDIVVKLLNRWQKIKIFIHTKSQSLIQKIRTVFNFSKKN